MIFYEDLIYSAAIEGNVDKVKKLISSSGHHQLGNVVSHIQANYTALLGAISAGYLDVVKLLIPVSNPRHFDSFALASAVAEFRLDMVQALLPVSDPGALGSRALKWSLSGKDMAIVKALLPTSDMKIANVMLDLFKEDEFESADRLTEFLSPPTVRHMAKEIEKCGGDIKRMPSLEAKVLALNLNKKVPSSSSLSAKSRL